MIIESKSEIVDVGGDVISGTNIGMPGRGTKRLVRSNHSSKLRWRGDALDTHSPCNDSSLVQNDRLYYKSDMRDEVAHV